MKSSFLPFLLPAFLLLYCSPKPLSDTERQQIIAELQAIKTLDQQYAGIPPAELTEAYGSSQAWEIFERQRDSIGQINQAKIKTLFEQYGYLGVDQVGEAASSDFWISIQHADNDVAFQHRMLAALKAEMEQGNADKVQYAMLEDRVNVNLGKPQRFGSQVTYNEFGQAVPKIGLADSAKVEEFRAAYEMPTFKEYYNDMTKSHFHMNRQYLLEKGITEPRLYE